MPEEAPETGGVTAPESATEQVTEVKDWKAEAEKWQSLARKNEERAKANASAAKELEAARQSSMTDQEKAVAEARKEALASANRRILTAEVRAAAAGKLADPADAIRFLDLDEFEVDDDGNVDGKAIAKAVKELLASKPYLADGAHRPAGTADGGARGNGVRQTDMNALLRQAAGRQ